jgi:hypothetical protein
MLALKPLQLENSQHAAAYVQDMHALTNMSMVSGPTDGTTGVGNVGVVATRAKGGRPLVGGQPASRIDSRWYIDASHRYHSNHFARDRACLSHRIV